MGIAKNSWEKELLERARELIEKKSGKLTFEVTLSGDGKTLRLTISGGPTTWYKYDETKKA